MRDYAPTTLSSSVGDNKNLRFINNITNYHL